MGFLERRRERLRLLEEQWAAPDIIHRVRKTCASTGLEARARSYTWLPETLSK
jgi:hypothetical protein